MIWAEAMMAGHRYERGVRRAGMVDFWRRLRHERRDLVRYDDVAARVGARPRQPVRLEYVPINQIVGSVGRAKDFTREFLPRPHVNQARWQGIDAAINGNVDLPPVELFRLGDVYFVNDGHHRISVAHANGFQGIEAYVTPVETKVALTPADFRDDEWLEKTAPQGQEEPMNPFLDAHLAQILYEERLKEAEMDRLARLMSAGEPGLWERLRLRLGEALVRLGNRLKTPYPTAPADAVPLGKL
jgi:hypothetical protein